MKKLIGLVVFSFSFNLLAIETNVFNEKYPQFQNYQQTLFAKLRNYFETLPLNSLTYIDRNGTILYQIQNKHNPTVVTLYSKITRERHEHKIIERVSYFLENGNAIEYEIIKQGEKSTPSDDRDLLSFNFKKTINDDFYQITVPTFNLQLYHSRKMNSEKQFFYLGLMEINIQIETFFQEHEASLNYIYFYKGMPAPQSSLTVRAIETPSSWSSINYIHYASQSGELSPNQFFQNLNRGAYIFTEADNEFFKILESKGFPSLD